MQDWSGLFSIILSEAKKEGATLPGPLATLGASAWRILISIPAPHPMDAVAEGLILALRCCAESMFAVKPQSPLEQLVTTLQNLTVPATLAQVHALCIFSCRFLFCTMPAQP